MAFPISPANNQTALVNGIVYQWNESLGVWKRNGSVDSITVGQLILNSGTESTSNTTGTIIVSGGAGITGNLYTSNIYISGTSKGITFPDGTIQTTAGVAVDSYARTTANAATALAQAAYDSANVIVGVNTTQNTNITSVNQYAASGYVLANTNAGLISIIQGVDTTQNTRISGVEGVNNAQNTNITTADSKAQASFDRANTAPITTTSSTAPVSPNIGDMWYDTDNDVLLRYTNDGTSNNWIDITGPIIRSSYIRQTYLISANVS